MTSVTSESFSICSRFVEHFTSWLTPVGDDKGIKSLGAKLALDTPACAYSASRHHSPPPQNHSQFDPFLLYPPPPSYLHTPEPPMSVVHHPSGLCTVRLQAYPVLPPFDTLEKLDPTEASRGTVSASTSNLVPHWGDTKTTPNKLVLVITSTEDRIPTITSPQASALFPLPAASEVVVVFRRSADIAIVLRGEDRVPLLPLLIAALVPVMYTSPVTFVDPRFMIPEESLPCHHEDIFEPLQESIYRAVERTFESRGEECSGDGYQAAHNWDMMTADEYKDRVGETQFQLEAS